jgi:hypothetical protein
LISLRRLDDLRDRVIEVDRLPVCVDQHVARLHSGHRRRTTRHRLEHLLRLRRHAEGQKHEQRQHDRGEVVGGRACQNGRHPHPARAVRIDHRIGAIELLVRVHPRDLDEAAQRNRRDLKGRPVALEPEQRRSEADREPLDPHAAEPGDQEVPPLVQHDEEAEPDDCHEDRQHCRKD